jgi:hypothetical protein
MSHSTSLRILQLADRFEIIDDVPAVVREEFGSGACFDVGLGDFLQGYPVSQLLQAWLVISRSELT